MQIVFLTTWNGQIYGSEFRNVVECCRKWFLGQTNHIQVKNIQTCSGSIEEEYQDPKTIEGQENKALEMVSKHR